MSRYTITAVQDAQGALTADADTILNETRSSFERQHGATQEYLAPEVLGKVKRPPCIFNHAQWRYLNQHPFTLGEVQRAIHKLKVHRTLGYDALLAEAYQRLTTPLQRLLAQRLWAIVSGQKPIPPEWANVVRGDWADPDNWRHIVCAGT